MATGTRDDGSTLRDYLRVVRLRKWVILQAVVLVPLMTVLLSMREERLFQAEAEILLGRQNLAPSLTDAQDPSIAPRPAERVAETEAQLARVPAVARRTLEAARVTGRTAQDLLTASEVTAKQNADLLEFRVTDRDRALAARLATEYARQFVAYRHELDTAALVDARQEVQARIARLEATGNRRSPLYRSLVEKEQELRTLEALQTSNAFLVRHADEARQVQPRPLRNGILGLALGLVLGIGFAFLWEALDTRVRSAEEIGERLGLPLLGRLPKPPRPLRRRDRLAMLEKPSGVHAEAFRMLRTNLDFVNLDRAARMIMITSAVEGEGKSTTAANLAVALARVGRRVILVDLDLRRPYLDRFFQLEYRPGIADVVLAHVDVERALAPIALGGPDSPVALDAEDADLPQAREVTSATALEELLTIRTGGPGGRSAQAVQDMPVAVRGGGNGDGRGQAHGRLQVLPSGPIPPDPGEFVGGEALADVLERLRERADLVLIDSAPLLHTGNATSLSTRVDGLLVVTRLNIIRRPMLTELHRVLAACPAEKLGFVLADSELEEGIGYGSSGYSRGYMRGEEDGFE